MDETVESLNYTINKLKRKKQLCGYKRIPESISNGDIVFCEKFKDKDSKGNYFISKVDPKHKYVLVKTVKDKEIIDMKVQADDIDKFYKTVCIDDAYDTIKKLRGYVTKYDLPIIYMVFDIQNRLKGYRKEMTKNDKIKYLKNLMKKKDNK